MHIDMKGRFADGVRVVRTFILVCIGDLFFRADNVPHALRMLKESVTTFNPQIFIDGSLLQLGLSIVDWGIVIISIAVLTCVSIMQYKMENAKSDPKSSAHTTEKACKWTQYSNVREYIADKNILLRWCIYIAFLFIVILLAEYGPGYSAAEFIYKDF